MEGRRVPPRSFAATITSWQAKNEYSLLLPSVQNGKLYSYSNRTDFPGTADQLPWHRGPTSPAQRTNFPGTVDRLPRHSGPTSSAQRTDFPGTEDQLLWHQSYAEGKSAVLIPSSSAFVLSKRVAISESSEGQFSSQTGVP
ncbi:hypothetical protein Bbelb_368910 [Branchiostoma belcheri]|nr:hypothetical protein Bbelb_368910 [Branchiostoma belcheri]